MNIDGIICAKCQKQIVKIDEENFECPQCKARWTTNEKWSAGIGKHE